MCVCVFSCRAWEHFMLIQVWDLGVFQSCNLPSVWIFLSFKWIPSDFKREKSSSVAESLNLIGHKVQLCPARLRRELHLWHEHESRFNFDKTLLTCDCFYSSDQSFTGNCTVGAQCNLLKDEINMWLNKGRIGLIVDVVKFRVERCLFNIYGGSRGCWHFGTVLVLCKVYRGVYSFLVKRMSCMFLKERERGGWEKDCLSEQYCT